MYWHAVSIMTWFSARIVLKLVGESGCSSSFFVIRTQIEWNASGQANHGFVVFFASSKLEDLYWNNRAPVKIFTHEYARCRTSTPTCHVLADRQCTVYLTRCRTLVSDMCSRSRIVALQRDLFLLWTYRFRNVSLSCQRLLTRTVQSEVCATRAPSISLWCVPSVSCDCH